METKKFTVTEFKALDDEEPGTFEAIVAVFNNVDRGGDMMLPGSFKRTLKEDGLPPIVWSHNWDEPPIGASMEAEEVEKGLRIKGKLFLEANDLARKVHAAMTIKDGKGQPPLRQFSFGYEVRDYDIKELDGEPVRRLKRVGLFEVGPTLVGMNPSTELVGAKDAGAATAEPGATVPPASTEPDDNLPNAPSAEEVERIGRLLADRPVHGIGTDQDHQEVTP